MNTHDTNPTQLQASGLPVIPPAARLTAFHAGSDVSTSDLTQTETLAHKASGAQAPVSGGPVVVCDEYGWAEWSVQSLTELLHQARMSLTGSVRVRVIAPVSLHPVHAPSPT